MFKIITKVRLEKYEKDLRFYSWTRIQANQTIDAYNNLPWWRKLFVFNLEVKCQHKKGYRCYCLDKEGYK